MSCDGSEDFGVIGLVIGESGFLLLFADGSLLALRLVLSKEGAAARFFCLQKKNSQKLTDQTVPSLFEVIMANLIALPRIPKHYATLHLLQVSFSVQAKK